MKNGPTLVAIVTVLTLLFFAAAPQPARATSNCVENGGANPCAPPVPLSGWVEDLCDDAAPTIQREAAWCVLKGGTWNSDGAFCYGMTPGALGDAGQFERKVHGDLCFGGGPTPPSMCSNYQCRCQNTYFGTVQIEKFTLLPFSGQAWDPNQGQCVGPPGGWAELVVDRLTRSAGCPAGYSQGSDSSGNVECYKPQPPDPECKECAAANGTSKTSGPTSVGNPIQVATGYKIQREQDYASNAPGGLSFVRTYNSGGFWDTATRDPSNSDFWRNNYSAKVVAISGNAFVSAVAVRASGARRYFNAGGVEMHNNDSAAYLLEKLTDGAGNITGWNLKTKESDVEAYDAQGRLTSITTRAGFVTTLAYNASAQLASVTDAFGRAITLSYDASGRLVTMTDPSSRLYQYAYDASGRLATVTYPDMHVRTYLYENTTWVWGLTGIVDERGLRYATFGYDAASGWATSTEHAGFDNKYTTMRSDTPTQTLVTVFDPFNNTLTYTYKKVNGTLQLTQQGWAGLGAENRTYDGNGNLASVTDRRGYVTNYTFDLTRNLETSRTEAAGTPVARTITTTWNPTYRLPATITEPSGVSGVNLVTTFTYDAAGNLTKRNVTAGSVSREWNYTYNARGQALTIDGPRTDLSDVTTMTYYGDTDMCVGCRGQLKTVTNAAAQTTTYDLYDPDGRLTQSTDANGVVATLSYTSRGWLQARTVGGETINYEYDAVGNLTKVTMPDASWLAYSYDEANGLIGVDDSLGNAIDYELDVFGNRVQESAYDPHNILTRTLQSLYDLDNRLQSDLGAAGQTTTYAYDNNNNVTSITDPLFRKTTNAYDALSRRIQTVDPANGTTTYGYDAKDRLTSVKDPKLAAATTYSYDGLGDLLTQTSPDTGATSFTYDSAGNVATKIDARGVATTYIYDALNRPLSATVTDGTVTYEYDNVTTGGAYATGRMTKVADPSGSTTYVYDALGRVTSKSHIVNAVSGTKTFTVTYNYSSGRPTGLTYPSGRAIAYGYNSQGQVTSISVDGVSLLSSAEYEPFGSNRKWTWANSQVYERTYDLDGRVSTLTLGPTTGAYSDLSQLFTYDSLNRLVSANLAAGQTQSFSYDANGNRTNATVNAASTTYNYPSTSHKLSSLTGATARSFAYDNAGNVTTTGGVSYVYDGRGRLKQAAGVTYLVNGLGQRVKKNGGADIFFAYDESGHLLGEYDASGAPIQETIWLGDMPVGVVKPKAGGFDLFYVWADQLGAPRMITDSANVSRWEWTPADPFGNNLPNDNPAGAGVFAYNLRFPGQYFDQETGMAYNMARDYDARIGRYIESDPIGLSGGINTYAYASSTPLNNSDPTGQFDATGPLGRALARSGVTMLAGGGPENPLGDALAVMVGVGSLAYDVYQQCKEKDCPPCRPYAKGTIGWTRLDTSHGHYPINGPHLHLRQVNQRKSDCKCFWNDANPKVAAPPPHPDWVDLSAGEPPLSP